jgi:Uncharacterized protein conserved in bacteria
MRQRSSRLGFLAGMAEVPDDFDTWVSEDIVSLFDGLVEPECCCCSTPTFCGGPHTAPFGSVSAWKLLETPEHVVAFSAALIWEVAVKASLKKPEFSVAPAVLRRGFIESGYAELDITSEHAAAVADLPPIHRDPFDRMLLARARVEGFTLLTSDARVAEYGAPALLV